MIFIGFSNDLIGVSKNHPFFAHVLERVGDSNLNFGVPYATEMFNNGPMFITRMAYTYAYYPERVRIVDEATQAKHLKNFHSSSWHTWDALLLRFLLHHWYLLVLAAVAIFAVGYVTVNECRKRKARKSGASSFSDDSDITRDDEDFITRGEEEMRFMSSEEEMRFMSGEEEETAPLRVEIPLRTNSRELFGASYAVPTPRKVVWYEMVELFLVWCIIHWDDDKILHVSRCGVLFIGDYAKILDNKDFSYAWRCGKYALYEQTGGDNAVAWRDILWSCVRVHTLITKKPRKVAWDGESLVSVCDVIFLARRAGREEEIRFKRSE